MPNFITDLKFSDWIGIILGFLGLAITIWQLHKTRTAAEAARDAAARTTASIYRIEAATKMHDVCSRSRELLRSLRDRSLSPAAHAAFELRDVMAKFGHDQHSREITTEELWNQAIAEAREIHERLESAVAVNRIDLEERKSLIKSVSQLHIVFTSLAAKAAANGVLDANSP